ncbi:MAG: hypothetical protein GY861_28645 [bacterium]|nr:hypothetical protein [bacterium]
MKRDNIYSKMAQNAKESVSNKNRIKDIFDLVDSTVKIPLNYKNIRGDIKTGDILLFSGNSLLSKIIKLTTRSNWSHVGMAIESSEHDMMLIWESTVRQKKNSRGIFPQVGVQISTLSQKVDEYDGIVAVRHLEKEFDSDMTKELKLFRREAENTPYGFDIKELLLAVYDGPLGLNIQDLSGLFCSELIAETYKRVGLVEKTIPSNEYIPSDFSSSSNIQLINNSLSKEILIKDENTQ